MTIAATWLPGEMHHDDHDHDGGDAAEHGHSHDAHDHAHTAAPAPAAREAYHEPVSAADHDDRTMPNPYRIPDAMPRHEPSEAPSTPSGGGGGNDTPPGEHHE